MKDTEYIYNTPLTGYLEQACVVGIVAFAIEHGRDTKTKGRTLVSLHLPLCRMTVEYYYYYYF